MSTSSLSRQDEAEMKLAGQVCRIGTRPEPADSSVRAGTIPRGMGLWLACQGATDTRQATAWEERKTIRFRSPSLSPNAKRTRLPPGNAMLTYRHAQHGIGCVDAVCQRWFRGR